MNGGRENQGNSADDMAEYLQTFLDETEEQLDDLVETMLALEQDSTAADELNEAFRLIHSIKGSAGMMGFDNITVLTHHLENRFERFRSGVERLDEATMNLVLRCIDFLRQCNNRLRDGEQLASSGELLDELRRLEEQAISDSEDADESVDDTSEVQLATDSPQSVAPPEAVDDTLLRLVVRFRAGLQLVDLKAQLIVARLSGLGDIQSTRPDLERVSETDQLEEFEVRLDTRHDLDRLRAAADVDGVESIEFHGASDESAALRKDGDRSEPTSAANDQPSTTDEAVGGSVPSTEQAEVGGESESAQPPAEPLPQQEPAAPVVAAASGPSEPAVTVKGPSKVSETMRVDIDRLDHLMNLAGELVVNRARFVQISGQINPALRKASMLNRIRDFSDGLRRTIDCMESVGERDDDWFAQIQQLRSGLQMMEEQTEIWHNGRRCISQMGEAIDQLSRVSHSLQRGVLETRMVPVAPLFNRFKRVVRDLSKERGKKVSLQIRGENTELDKRMIDELGDPLVHLVRNSIDHGLEPTDLRVVRGKPEVGTICLEASHRGNSVFIHVRDDGGGIDVGKIKSKLIENRVLSESAADELTEQQTLEYIWHPGFSTAKVVTDVSGRGVGMDVVKTRITQLNGTIEIESTPEQGTTFTIRLPLTLAIIHSLLARIGDVIFSMPIDDVREIVSVKPCDIVCVHGKRTFDARGEYVPLLQSDDVFQWHGIDYGYDRATDDETGMTVSVVILNAGGKTVGLVVDELLGSQDIVIKSLSDNFMNIRGLSGASILGDGSVSLMLDVGTVIDLATRSSKGTDVEEKAL